MNKAFNAAVSYLEAKYDALAVGFLIGLLVTLLVQRVRYRGPSNTNRTSSIHCIWRYFDGRFFVYLVPTLYLYITNS